MEEAIWIEWCGCNDCAGCNDDCGDSDECITRKKVEILDKPYIDDDGSDKSKNPCRYKG